MLGNINKLVEAEQELSDTPGSVLLDIVVPKLGEKKLSKIPLLVGGESGLDLVTLDETKEGAPLVHTLRQQARTIPSVRVYCEPKITSQVRKRFDAIYPMSDVPSHREDEYDLTEY
jgi:hypothetical protein